MAISPQDVSPEFRWSLVPRDRLGSLLDGCQAPALPDLEELVQCAAKVLARSGGGRLLFVGRAADSLFDLLSGVLAGTDHHDRIARLDYSFRGDVAAMTRPELEQARAILTAARLTPERLVQGREPVALVDLVSRGHTFTGLFRVLRDWIDEQNASWADARLNLRFLGITARATTGPNTQRRQQSGGWVGDLPAESVVNVSLDPDLYSYWASSQPKLTRSLDPGRWTVPDQVGPRRDEQARLALAEAVALVDLGARRNTRTLIARALEREPAFAQHWLRLLAAQIRLPILD